MTALRLLRRAALLVLPALLAAALPVQANGLDALETFLRTARSGRAEFTQVVTAPPRDGQAGRSKTSTGSFEFQRPSRFRFVYKKPFEQTLVADGQTLWMHDVDLNQVTARRQAQVLGATPAALIATAADLAALRQEFDLTAQPDQGGLQWVQALPRVKDGQLRHVRVGFRGAELATLEILDSFGQRSVMSFSRMEINPALPDASFQFRVPAGADLIRQ